MRVLFFLLRHLTPCMMNIFAPNLNQMACQPMLVPTHRPHPSYKRPPTAFMLFSYDSRRELILKCPEMRPCDVTALLSHLWRTLDKTTKDNYKRLAYEMAAKIRSVNVESKGAIYNQSTHSKPKQKKEYFPLLEPCSVNLF